MQADRSMFTRTSTARTGNSPCTTSTRLVRSGKPGAVHVDVNSAVRLSMNAIVFAWHHNTVVVRLFIVCSRNADRAKDRSGKPAGLIAAVRRAGVSRIDGRGLMRPRTCSTGPGPRHAAEDAGLARPPIVASSRRRVPAPRARPAALGPHRRAESR